MDYIVVGGGIGGTIAYLLLKTLGKSVVLFEKLDYLGGCAGTFKRDGLFFNVGASTLVGLEDNLPLDVLLKILGIEKSRMPIKEIDPSILVFVGDKVISRYKDFERSFEEINRNFYHRENRKLWERILMTSKTNWEHVYKVLPFNPRSCYKLASSVLRNSRYLLSTLRENFLSAERVIRSYLGNVEKDYQMFLNSQILMTTQCYWNEVNFSFASMGLTYTNLSNYYVKGGMAEFLHTLVGQDENVKRKTKVLKISKERDHFKVYTNRGTYEAKRLILNRTIWDFCDLFDDSVDKGPCEKNRKTYSKIWSASTLYFGVKDPQNLLDKHHYQIVHPDENPYTGSYSFFVSVADPEDTVQGYRPVVISTHCKIEKWEDIKSKEDYQERKEKLKDFILEKLYQHIPTFRNLEKTPVLVGTPHTFRRYTERYKGTVGGIPLRFEYTMLRYPVGFTYIKDVYLVGDSVFPGQGYPGVVLGVFNLLMQIERDFHEVLHRYI